MNYIETQPVKTTAPPKKRPILFSAPMVRAILEGRKTVTRRVPKAEVLVDADELHPYAIRGRNSCWHTYATSGEFVERHSPYGKPGDILWVRETFCKADIGGRAKIFYRADWEPVWNEPNENIIPLDKEGNSVYRVERWNSSIFMPRAACRLRLRVVDVRVERLQQISESQAKAEGVESLGGNLWRCYDDKCAAHKNGYNKRTSATDSFMSLWNSINRKNGYGWDANPFVWVVEFERIEN